MNNNLKIELLIENCTEDDRNYLEFMIKSMIESLMDKQFVMSIELVCPCCGENHKWEDCTYEPD